MSAPSLQDFAVATALGPRVWVERGSAGLAVRGGDRAPAAAGLVPALAVFTEALCDRFGDDVALMALRELGPGLDAKATVLPSDALVQVIGCAESMTTLSDARGQVLKLEYSATLLGRRFVAVCQAMGTDAAALPLSHRQAIDETLRRSGGLGGETLEDSLRRLLARPPLH